MRFKFRNQITIALGCVLAFNLLFMDSSAQQRRRRRPSRRVTNPVRTPAQSSSQSDAPEIISTADAPANGSDNNATQGNGTVNRNRAATSSRSAATDSDAEATRRSVNKLSTDVTRLSEKLSQMEEQQRTLVDLERLSRAEQRAENLRTQLRDVVSKEADLQARSEQIDIDLQPGNIERSLAGVGSLHPEELRAQRRRQLESEKSRVASQLSLLTSNHARLDTAIASADVEVDRLRQRVDAANATLNAIVPAPVNNAPQQTGVNVNATASPTPTPSPSPSPNDSALPR